MVRIIVKKTRIRICILGKIDYNTLGPASFGNKSKQALVTLVYGKEVRLVDQGDVDVSVE